MMDLRYLNNTENDIEQRANALFVDHSKEIYEQTDRLFAWLMIYELFLGVLVAFIFSPKLWPLDFHGTNMFVWDAFFFGGVIIVLPVTLAFFIPGKVVTRYVIAVGQMLFAALLIHLTCGRIETHFHILVSLAILVFYRDWKILVTASLVIVIYHCWAGHVWPYSVFGVATPSSWRWVEHAAWILFEDIFLIGLCFRSTNEMMKIAQNTAELEFKNEQLDDRERQLIHLTHNLDKKVHERTMKLNNALEELKTTHTQLIQSEKLASIGQLAAGVAHEINNPMGFISNNMELLEKYLQEYNKILALVDDLKKSVEDTDMDKAKEIVRIINTFSQEIQLDFVMNDTGKLLKHNQRGIERIQKIVMDLRTFAREDNDVMELASVEEVIDSVLSIVSNEIKFKVELKKNYAQTPLIKCNPQRIGQVFINLIVNAAQAISEKGIIEIKTYVRDKFICVDVKDSGVGIPPENIHKIFDAFFTTKQVGHGTGLGLSLSFDIIKKHGGDIKVRSSLGEGTVFTVMLPLVTSKIGT